MTENRICLTHGTADRLLESLSTSGAELHPSSLQACDFSPNAEQMLEEIREICGTTQDGLNLLVGKNNDNRPNSTTACHRFFGQLPLGSILHVEGGIYLASPCLNLLLEARDLHLVNLCTMLGRYLGTFSSKKASTDGSTIISRSPMVTADDLSLYLSRFSRTAGTGNLRDAMRYTCENAASPQEVNLQLALCLPPWCNGYALKKPRMNYPIKLGPKERTFYDVDHIRIDLYWPEAHFGLEYQGEEEHENQMLADIARWYAARKKGAELWFVTKEQLGSAEQLDFIAREVAKRTRKRINEETWPTIEEAQRLLDVFRGGKWLNPDERLRERPMRSNRRVA